MPLDTLTICDGGLTGTAIAAVAILGGKAAFAGKLGNSSLAQRAMGALEDVGVDCSLVIRNKDSEPITAFVFSDSTTGKRNIFFSRDGVSYPEPDELPDRHWFKNCSVLLIDYESGHVGIEMAKIARKHGLDVVCDIEQMDRHTADFIQYSNHVVLSRDFALDYCKTNDIDEALRQLKVTDHHHVIITRGDQGCSLCTSENVKYDIPAFKVEVVDTNGCGDVFHGAYALQIARGYPSPEAARFASAAAALCATKIGGRTGVPTKQEVDKFIKSNKA